MLIAHRSNAMASITVKNKDKVTGLLYFTSVKKRTVFGEDHLEILTILSNILSDALVKVTSELEVRYMAYYDALTGLPNQTLFKDRLKHAILNTNRTGKLFSVLFMDLDAFKAVNDTLGHQGGDEMLQQVAGRLTEKLRACDTVLGIAVYPEDGSNGDALIKNADLAMYEAKRSGKNQFCLCTSKMKADVLQKTKLSNMLYRALENEEFFLLYQPQVNASTREIVGVEALIRWNNPEYGLISPGIFIPLAEQTGLINPIGKWVLRTACKQLKAWQEASLPHLRLSVNVSVEQFRDRELSRVIQSILTEAEYDSNHLELEITEGIAIEANEFVINELKKLQELGISIAIDDFGTEYSSLNRLNTLPVDRIKIDMQFVQNIQNGDKEKAIAKTLIQMAKNLDLKVIAEGVETEEQYGFFSKHQCDEIQGFYFYKPLLPEEIEGILKDKLID